MRAKLREIKEELRRRMHWPMPEQGKWPRQTVIGYFGYFADPTNSRALSAFRFRLDRSVAAYASGPQSAERPNM